MADIEEDLVGRCLEDTMQRDRELDHAEVWPKVASRFGQGFDQFLPDLLGKCGQGTLRQFFQVGWGINTLQQVPRMLRIHDSSNGLSADSPRLLRVMISIRFSAASSFSRQIWSNFIPSS